MSEIIRDVISDVVNLTSLITNSKLIPLNDKVHAKGIEVSATDKLNSMGSINPFGAQKIVKDFLTVGDVNKVANISISNINAAILSLSSLISQKDKLITNINLNPPLKDRKVINTFNNTVGFVKIELSTETKKYLIVLGDDEHYHFATEDYWMEVN